MIFRVISVCVSNLLDMLIGNQALKAYSWEQVQWIVVEILATDYLSLIICYNVEAYHLPRSSNEDSF